MVSERLGIYIKMKGISYYAFENSIGVSRGSISKAVKDKKSIGSSILENILLVYEELNPVWLLTGKSEMIVKDETNKNNNPTTEGSFSLTVSNITTYILENRTEFETNKEFQLLLEAFHKEHKINVLQLQVAELRQKIEEITSN